MFDAILKFSLQESKSFRNYHWYLCSPIYEMLKVSSLLPKESRRWLFGLKKKKSYEEWDCIFWREKDASLTYRWLFRMEKHSNGYGSWKKVLWKVNHEKRVLYVVRTVRRVYAPQFLSHHNKDLEWQTLKPPSACHSSRVLDRPCYSSQVSNRPCYSS